MSKTITFSVSVTFNEAVTDQDQIMEIAQNIADGIQKHSHNVGVAPKGNYTTNFEVTPLNEEIGSVTKVLSV
jgi:hypothetical protein